MRPDRFDRISARHLPAFLVSAVAGGRVCVVFFSAFLVLGCERADTGMQTTGKTVHQEKLVAVKDLGGYRSVEMPERARQNFVAANPSAAGAIAYKDSISNR